MHARSSEKWKVPHTLPPPHGWLHMPWSVSAHGNCALGVRVRVWMPEAAGTSMSAPDSGLQERLHAPHMLQSLGLQSTGTSVQCVCPLADHW